MSLQDEITRVRKYITNPQKMPPNESCTCEWVILPLLWKSGYEHDEILSRTPDIAGKFPDYTVLPDTQYTWYLEAKAWTTELQNEHVIQAMNYAHTTGKRWVVLSNGREWRLYDDHIQGVEAGQRLVAIARLEDCDLEKLLIALSKESIMSGGLEIFVTKSRLSAILDEQLHKADSEVVKTISSLLKNKLGLASIQHTDIVAYFQEKTAIPTVSPTPSPLQSSPLQTTGDKPRTLDDLVADGNKLKDTIPDEVTLPDGSRFTVSSWRDVVFAVVRWIAEQGKLKTLPFRGLSNGERWFLNTKPQHKNGGPMDAYREIQLSHQTIYIHMNRGSIDFVTCLVALCKDTGISASQITVSLKK